MSWLGAFENEQLVLIPNDDPGMPELVRRKEQRGHEVQLYCIDEPRARRLVEQDDVACPKRAANRVEGEYLMLLVSEAPPLDPLPGPGGDAIRRCRFVRGVTACELVRVCWLCVDY